MKEWCACVCNCMSRVQCVVRFRWITAWGKRLALRHPVAPPRGQEVEQAVVGMNGIAADAEPSTQAVFMLNVSCDWELVAGDMLGHLYEPLQGSLICACVVTAPH